jgi:AcrR family transcriptional regulator
MDRDERQGHRRGTAAQRRAQIIAATMRLIARDGVAAVSTRTIAREAAVNLAALHDLFGRKDDLLLVVLDTATATMIAALVSVDVHPGWGLRAALTESFATLSAMLDREPVLPLVRCELLLYARRRPTRAAGAAQQGRYLEALAACFRMAGAEGELGLPPSEELAAAVSSSIDGLALQTATGVPLSEQSATRDQVLRALLALVPRPSTGLQADGDGGGASRLGALCEEEV